MKILEFIKKVEESKEYTDWKKEHENYFLAHVFKMMDKENENQWQIGYCDEESNNISTFLLEGETVKVLEESKPFKEPGSMIQKLDIDKVKLDWEEALDKAEELKKLKYPKELPIKSFFILQKIENENVYNITFFTQTFQALNIRVTSDEGKVVHDNMSKFFEMGA